MNKRTVAGFGEVMLRLSPPGKMRFAQTFPGTLEVTYGGGEANVCASLAMLGMKSRYLTALPDNPVAQAFSRQMRGIGVDTEHIKYTTTGRMGVYYSGIE
jgi:2-dehydro-3-deoxygluconokinase